MEQKIFNQILGYYNSSFFRMHIATNESIENINLLSEKTYATLAHEYMHFIQDITTIYGLNNIFATIQYIKYANNEIYKTQGDFHVPILSSNVNTGDFVYFNKYITYVSFGETKAYNNAEIIGFNPTIIQIDEKCVIKKMKVVELEARIDNSYNIKYRFGAGCIYESMAKIMEKKMSPTGSVNSPDLPYNTAIKLAKHIYKDFAENELNVLAICDISLNCSNPGKVFVEMLYEFKRRKIIPQNPREIYDDFYNRKFEDITATKNKTVSKQNNYLTAFEDRSKLVEKELYSYFRPTIIGGQDEFNKIMTLINNWIAEIFATALKWRKENPYFIIDIAEGGEKGKNIAFVRLFNAFGLPFCTNNNHDGYYYHPNFLTANLQLSYFSAVSQILRIFEGDLGMCDFYEYCKKCKIDNTSDVVTDSRCVTPWERCCDNRLCPVATIWKHWNLGGHIPTSK
jgi:hypothetical protein